MKSYEFEKILSSFQEGIKEYLTLNNLTVHQFSRNLNIPQRTIHHWLHKDCLADITALIKISNETGTSIDYILGLTDNQKFTKSSNPKTFYERFIFSLNQKNFGIREFQRMSNMRNSSFYKWKVGRLPDTYTVINLCEIFDCSFEYLIGREDK